MAQHSKPSSCLNALITHASIVNVHSTCGELDPNPQDSDPVSKRSLHLRALTRLLSFIGGLVVSCIALPSHAETARVYIVEVLSDSEDVLEVVRTAVSDAYIVTKEDGTQSIIAGTFVDEANARRQATELHALEVSPTSISPLEYTSEDDANQATAPAATATEVATTELGTAREEAPTVPEFVAPNEPTPNSAPNPQPELANSTPQSVAAAPQANPSTAPGGGSSIAQGQSDRQYSTLVPVPNGTDPEATLAEVQHFFPDASLQAFNQGQAVETGTFSHRSQAQLQADWLETKGLRAISVPAEPLGTNSAPVPASPTTVGSPPTTSPPTANFVSATETTNQPEVATNSSVPASANTGTTASASAQPVAPPADALASIAPPSTNLQTTEAATLPTGENLVAPSPVGDVASSFPTAPEPQPELPSAAVPVAAAPPVNSAAFWVLIADPMGEQLDDIQAIVPTAETTLYNQQQVVRTGEFATEEEALDQVRYLSTQGYEAGIFNANGLD